MRMPIAIPDLAAAALIAVAAIAVALLLRFAGTLERVDLAWDDLLARSTRSPVTAEGFILLVGREEDLAKPGVIEKIAAAGPLAIGIDTNRSLPAPAGTTGDRVYVACGGPLTDPDGAMRRVLVQTAPGGRACYSLGFQLARHAARLKGEDWSLNNDAPPRLVVGAARMRTLVSGDGPYASIGDGGFQVAIAAATGTPAFDTASVSDVMEGRVDPSRLRDRIVVAGSDATSLRMNALVAAHFLDVAQLRSDPPLLLHGRGTIATTIVLAFLMAVIACSRRRLWRVAAYGTAVAAMYALSALALAAGAIFFGPAAPALAMAVAFAGGVARDLVS